MKNVNVNIFYSEYNSVEELDKTDRLLIESAGIASSGSYAPYSKFQVGAAVLLANGEIITGSNQENAAYPSGLCAERVAIFYANAKFPEVPVIALAIIAFSDGHIVNEPVSPCGSCRQVILESELRFKYPVKIIMCASEKVRIVKDVHMLLPLSFGMDSPGNW